MNGNVASWCTGLWDVDGWAEAWRSVAEILARITYVIFDWCLNSKARSTPATMSKQHCRMLQCRMLSRHCCRFWQQCQSNVRLCCQKRRQCRTSFALKFRPFDKVERCFDIVAQNGNIVEATGNKVACRFDNVASTLLLVWTGLNWTTLWWVRIIRPKRSTASGK